MRDWTKSSNASSCSRTYFRYRMASSGPRWIPSRSATPISSSTSGTAYIGCSPQERLSNGVAWKDSIESALHVAPGLLEVRRSRTPLARTTLHRLEQRVLGVVAHRNGQRLDKTRGLT